MTELLRIDHLTIEDGQSSDKVLVNNLSFSLAAGETLAIVGESGSGKSLTAQAIMRLLPKPAVKISAGEIRFKGQDILALSSEALCDIRGRDISMIFQEPQTALNPVYSIGKQLREQIALHQSNLSSSEIEQKALELLNDVGLSATPAMLNKYPHELSGGMRQRVVIAMALSCSPALLIADEPTTALDVEVQAQILILLQQLQQKYHMAMIFISHDLAVVADLCDRLLVMYQGQLIEQLHPSQLVQAGLHPYTQALMACNLSDAASGEAKPWRCELPVIPAAADVTDHPNGTGLESEQARDLRFSTALENYQQQLQAKQPAQPSIGYDQHLENAETVLELRNICKSFTSGKSMFRRNDSRQKVLTDISLQLKRGETLGLVGASGSGKSTLSKIISGLLQPDSGQVLFSSSKDSAIKYGKDQARRIQYVFQDPLESLNPRHKVADIISEPLRIQGEKNSQALRCKATELLKICGLDEQALNKYPHQFSGGQKQRIGIARALALEPEILICDEPVSALDVSVQAQIINLLIDLQRRLGIAMIFISHDLTVVKHISHNIAVLHEGEIVEYGNALEIFDSPQHHYTQRLIAATPSWREGETDLA